MIRRPTVFVLGAGASMPYGLPSGAGLRSQICAATVDPEKSNLGQRIISCGQVASYDVKKFGEAFSRSGVISIDAFLTRRPELAGIGKFAIAATIASLEDTEPILSDATTDHWYRLLWNAMLQDASEPMDIARSDVRFITFNYDRSLEYFFHEAIKNSFGKEDQAEQVLGKMSILHVYGSLGPFVPDRRSGSRYYGEKTTPENLALSARSLLVIPEARDDEPFKLARNWFGRAERICFLGFGFDPLNVDRLGLSSVLSWKEKEGGELPQIYASVLDKTVQEVGAHRYRLIETRAWTTFEATNCMTLRQTPLLF